MLCAVALTGCTYDGEGEPPKGEVEIPSVIGMDVETAERMLAGLGMKVSPGQRFVSADGVHFRPRPGAELEVTRQIPVGAAPPGTPVALASTDVGMDFVQLAWSVVGYADGRLTLHVQNLRGQGCTVVDHVRIGPDGAGTRVVDVWGSLVEGQTCTPDRIVLDVGDSWTAGTAAAIPTPVGTAG